jgi:hypothetical protein
VRTTTTKRRKEMDKTKNKKLFNIFFATAVGVCIGFVLIKEYFADISIWLSLVGGLIGAGSAYILNDWHGALSGIAEAWKLTKNQAPKIVHVLVRVLVSIIKIPFIKSDVTRTYIFFQTLAITNMCITLATYYLASTMFMGDHVDINLIAFIALITYCFFVLTFVICAIATVDDYAITEEFIKSNIQYNKRYAFWALPFIHLPYLLYIVLINIPIIVKYVAMFGIKFLLLIHTTDRLISAVDAFLFAMLAYGIGVLGNSWVAGSVGIHLAVFAISGGVFGIFNKLYIKPLLEKWALRLKPAVTAEE